MYELLEQIEQCLYQLKHSQHRLDINIKQAVNGVEVALQDLIRLVESQSNKGVNNDSSRNTIAR